MKSMNQISNNVAMQTALVRSAMYKLLANSFLYPTEKVFSFICSPLYEETLEEYQSFQSETSMPTQRIQDFVELIRTLRGRQSLEGLEQEYNRLFAHLGSTKCPPYETEYGYDNVFQKTDAMADIAGFYSAYGLEISDINAERVDLISTELEFMSYLTANEAYAREHRNNEQTEICLDTQRKFIHDHLGRWVTLFTQLIKKSTANQFYVLAGELTEEFLNAEARNLGIVLEKVPVRQTLSPHHPEPFGCESSLSAGQNDSVNKSVTSFKV